MSYFVVLDTNFIKLYVNITDIILNNNLLHILLSTFLDDLERVNLKNFLGVSDLTMMGPPTSIYTWPSYLK